MNRRSAADFVPLLRTHNSFDVVSDEQLFTTLTATNCCFVDCALTKTSYEKVTDDDLDGRKVLVLESLNDSQPALHVNTATSIAIRFSKEKKDYEQATGSEFYQVNGDRLVFNSIYKEPCIATININKMVDDEPKTITLRLLCLNISTDNSRRHGAFKAVLKHQTSSEYSSLESSRNTITGDNKTKVCFVATEHLLDFADGCLKLPRQFLVNVFGFDLPQSLVLEVEGLQTFAYDPNGKNKKNCLKFIVDIPNSFKEDVTINFKDSRLNFNYYSVGPIELIKQKHLKPLGSVIGSSFDCCFTSNTLKHPRETDEDELKSQSRKLKRKCRDNKCSSSIEEIEKKCSSSTEEGKKDWHSFWKTCTGADPKYTQHPLASANFSQQSDYPCNPSSPTYWATVTSPANTTIFESEETPREHSIAESEEEVEETLTDRIVVEKVEDGTFKKFSTDPFELCRVIHKFSKEFTIQQAQIYLSNHASCIQDIEELLSIEVGTGNTSEYLLSLSTSTKCYELVLRGMFAYIQYNTIESYVSSVNDWIVESWPQILEEVRNTASPVTTFVARVIELVLQDKLNRGEYSSAKALFDICVRNEKELEELRRI